MFRVPVVLFVVCLIDFRSCKQFDKCEMRNTLLNTYGISKSKASSLVCVGYHRSKLRTNFEDGQRGDKYFGLFAISGKWWCGINEPRNQCQVNCSALLDDDITDDIDCASIILDAIGIGGWGQTRGNCANIKKELELCLNDETKDLLIENSKRIILIETHWWIYHLTLLYRVP